MGLGSPSAFLINILSIYNPAYLSHTPSSLIRLLFVFLKEHLPSRQTQCSQKLQPTSVDRPTQERKMDFLLLFRNYFYQSCLSSTTSFPLLPLHVGHVIKFAYKAITQSVLFHVIISFILIILLKKVFKNMSFTVVIFRGTRYPASCYETGLINKSRVIKMNTERTQKQKENLTILSFFIKLWWLDLETMSGLISYVLRTCGQTWGRKAGLHPGPCAFTIALTGIPEKTTIKQKISQTQMRTFLTTTIISPPFLFSAIPLMHVSLQEFP